METPKARPLTDDIQVVFFDLWLTLVYGLKTDPILTLQKLLSGNAQTQLDGEFLTTCLTTNVKRPNRFISRVAMKHGYSVSPQARSEFRQLLKAERNAATKYPETESTLTELAGRGFRLGLISNLWPFPVNRIFKQMELGRHFEHCIFSFEAGLRKPNRGIFEAACQRFGVKPENCLMIGDSLESDVRGALALGMKAVLVARPGMTPTNLPAGVTIIDNLAALKV